ncbi:MAG: hypothetical protein HRU11_14835 [Parvularculaceae bacterium]|nr:hypothetical protein [Parvularculaceae bacterium]
METIRTLLNKLEGRTGDIARTVEREIKDIAPYAELGLAMGVPTWHLHDRVVSLLPLPNRCQLHFWDGEALEALFPDRLAAPSHGPMRYLRLESMFDVDENVREVLKGAFSLKIDQLAEADACS